MLHAIYSVKPGDEPKGVPGSKRPGPPLARSRPEEHLNILVVDDSLANRTAMRAALYDFGHIPILAPNGPAALRVLLHEGGPELDIDLVLLDLHMPGMNGFEVLESIRARWSRIELPVIVVTANSTHDLLVEAFRRGANDFVQKPIDADELQVRVEAHAAIKRESRFRITGGHRRLARDQSGSLKALVARPHTDTFGMCTSCQTIQPATARSCYDCGVQRPDSGWPAIDRNNTAHLGRIIGGRYLLEKPLGSGGTGVVYRARDLELDRRFAVKVIALPSGSRAAMERLQVEVGVMARSDSPHIVRIYEVLQLDDETVALVTNFIDGITLAEMIHRHQCVPPSLALEITRQIAQGLHAVHALGMVHRDVKPHNIMIEALPGGYFVHILDFGIAVALQAARCGNLGYFQGTPLYAAPEQSAMEGEVNERADIYSLGVTLYEMLTGAPPFASASLLSLFLQHRHSQIPDLPSELGPANVRQLLDALLREMMEKRAAERLGSVSELIERLDEVNNLLKGHTEGLDLSPLECSSNRVPRIPTHPTLVDDRSPRLRQLHPPLSLPAREPLLFALATDQTAAAIATGEGKATLTLFDFVRSTTRQLPLALGANPTALALAPGGLHAYVGTDEGRVEGVVLKPDLGQDGSPSQRSISMSVSTHPIVALAVSEEDGWIAAADEAGEVHMMSPGATADLCVHRSAAPIKALVFGDGPNPVVVTEEAGVVNIGDHHVKATLTLAPPSATITRAVLCPDGESALLLTDRGQVLKVLFDGAIILKRHQFPMGTLVDLAFTSAGASAISRRGEVLELWSLESVLGDRA